MWSGRLETISSDHDVDWLPKPNTVDVILDATAPPTELITAAAGLIFDGEKLLMTRSRLRGWEIPTGHLELGETPEEAVQREVYEETATRVRNLRYYGYAKLVIRAPKPDGYKYPYPDSYIVAYIGEVASQDEFEANDETAERTFLDEHEVRRTEWAKFGSNRALYDLAREVVLEG